MNHLVPEQVRAVQHGERANRGLCADARAAVEALPPRERALQAREAAVRRYVPAPRAGELSSKMLGGASQIVSMIRVKCNGK